MSASAAYPPGRIHRALGKRWAADQRSLGFREIARGSYAMGPRSGPPDVWAFAHVRLVFAEFRTFPTLLGVIS